MQGRLEAQRLEEGWGVELRLRRRDRGPAAPVRVGGLVAALVEVAVPDGVGPWPAGVS